MNLILKTNDEQFYLQRRITDYYYVSVTNLKLLWSSSFTKDEILQCFKADNCMLRSSDEKLLRLIDSLLTGQPRTDTVVEKNEDHVSLTLYGEIQAKLKIRLTLELKAQSAEKFYEEITMPMVLLVNSLIDQRAQLCSIVKAKDVELNEYKMEGAEISRKNVETEVFKEDIYLKQSTEDIIKNWRSSNEFQLSLSADLSTIFSEVSRPRGLLSEIKSEPGGEEPPPHRNFNSRLPSSKRRKKLTAQEGSSCDSDHSKGSIGANIPRTKVTRKKVYL